MLSVIKTMAISVTFGTVKAVWNLKKGTFTVSNTKEIEEITKSVWMSQGLLISLSVFRCAFHG